jgi:acyl carrier protein
VAELRRRLEEGGRTGDGVDPEALWQLAEELGCRLEISWAEPGSRGLFDAVLWPAASDEAPAPNVFGYESPPPRRWQTYANQPLQGMFARRLLPELREHVRQRLPDALVPAAFVVLERLPLTANGKLNRRALPAPDTLRPELEGTYRPPESETEEQLSELWGEILGLERVGVDDRFFELGGHSLLAVQLLSRVRRHFQVEVSLLSFFDNPTIAGMAAVIEGSEEDDELRKLEELFRQVEEMSQEEARTEIERREG